MPDLAAGRRSCGKCPEHKTAAPQGSALTNPISRADMRDTLSAAPPSALIVRVAVVAWEGEVESNFSAELFLRNTPRA